MNKNALLIIVSFIITFILNPLYTEAGNLTLSYSSYLGGVSDESGKGIALDSSGNAYVTGYTYSTNFPTQSPYQGTGGGGTTDVFISKLSSSGNTLSYSTYLGGGNDDAGSDIAVDSTGNAYVTGSTNSTNFPTESPYQGTYNNSYDVFISKLSPSGSTLSYSTYLGGSGGDSGRDIVLDSSGSAYVTGTTDAADFPTQSPYQGTKSNFSDVFISKLSPSGSDLSYSTYLGGGSYDSGFGITLDSSDNVYVTGDTGSANFPTRSPYQGTGGAPMMSLSVSFLLLETFCLTQRI